MSRIWILMIGGAFAGQAPAADLSGKVVDAQTGAPIARAHVEIQVTSNSGQAGGLAVLTDASGAFVAHNLTDGGWQLSCEKAGYVSSFAVVSGAAKPPLVLRMARQAVIEGAVMDQDGVGVPFASVQLFQWAVLEGRRRIQAVSGSQTDERGEFRIFGLAPGRYYAGANAQFQQRSGNQKLAYMPVLYPGTSDIGGAQAIELEPGTEEHVKIRLLTVPARRVRGRLMSPGKHQIVEVQPLDRERFPVALNLNSFWDEKTNKFTISGVPSGVYLLEAATDIDGRQHRAVRSITIGNKDLDDIIMAPASLPEVTGTITIDGKAQSAIGRSQISLRSPRSTAAAEVQNDGSFRIADVPPGSYRISVTRSDSAYVRSIRQGGRDVQRDGISVGESPTGPLDIDLSSHGGTIEGIVAMLDSGASTAILVGLFRSDGEELVFDKQAYVDPASSRPANTVGRFTMQGIAPGDYVLLAWPSDARIEYAEPEPMRQFRSRGKIIRVAEDAKISVLLDAVLTIAN